MKFPYLSLAIGMLLLGLGGPTAAEAQNGRALDPDRVAWLDDGQEQELDDRGRDDDRGREGDRGRDDDRGREGDRGRRR